MSKFNRKYKDSVFTDLFGSDRDGKRNFLSLYNALTGKDYKFEETEIERRIIDQTLYKTFNNDVSMEINGKLIVLVEHQSSINENMPLRCLEYVTRIYEEIVPSDVRYAERVYNIPNPEFYVIYVGQKKYPKEKNLCLSDAFYQKDNSCLELCVKVINCSDSSNLPVIKKCDILKQYCLFIDIVEKNLRICRNKRAFKKAVQEAIERNILSEYLLRKSQEVINMLCAKYSYKTDLKVHMKEAFEDGMSQGAENNAIKIAKAMLKDNFSPDLTAKYTGLSLNQIFELKNKIESEK